MKKKDKYIKYKTLIIVCVIALLIALLSLLLSKLVLPLSIILVFIGLLYLSIYYPKKKDNEEDIEVVIISKDDSEKKKEELRKKLKDDVVSIDIKTVKDCKNEDKVIAIDIVSVKDDKEDKKVSAYIKQDNVTDKDLFTNNIPKKEYAKAKGEKEVVTKLAESIRELKKNPTIIAKSKEDAKKINKVLKNNISTKPNYVVVSTKSIKENKESRAVNAKKPLADVYNACGKEIKENKIEPLTKEEKLSCAYIKTTIDDKDIKFSKDKDGYINVIGASSSVRFKIGKKDKYVILPKEDVKNIKLDKKECSEEENKNINVRVVLNKIKDILTIKNPLIKLLRKEKIIKEKKDEYSFNISLEEAKKIIKLEQENKKLLNKIEDINKNANILHNSKNYNQELKLLNKGINKLKDKNINITNLVIRRNNLLKFLNQEKEKQKQLKKVNNNN